MPGPLPGRGVTAVMEEQSHQVLSKWMEGSGPASDVVLSSRVRLARNLEELPYPHVMDSEQARNLIARVEAILTVRRGDPAVGSMRVIRLAELSPPERLVLVEKHLISPQLAKQAKIGAVAVRDDAAVSVMINEEDHLRIQCLFPGLQLEEAAALAAQIDDLLEDQLPFAFDERLGYLTACPTNVGTGLRASVMAHLPALVITNQASRIIAAITKLGLVVRGIYGEGTEAVGNIFQISNQITLGQSEEEILHNLKGLTRQIIDQERQARETLLKEMKDQIHDRVCRAYGILRHARVMSSQEAMQHLSDVRLGVDLKLVPDIEPRVLNELLVLTRPAHLQLQAGRELGTAERDLRRAALIRHRFAAAGRSGPEEVA